MTNITKFDLSDLTANPKRSKDDVLDYIITPALNNAVKVALQLQLPLLITGKPGTGKTRLAEKLARDFAELFNGKFLPFPLIFNTKTISSYTDLLYQYDALGHFHRSNISNEIQAAKMGSPDVPRFIQLKAFGQAILLSSGEYQTDYKNMPEVRDYLESHPETTMKGLPLSSVILIDEVDKAPRDFTNDLLNEIDRFEFTVSEDNGATYRQGEGNIFMIITSNSEKGLPDAFLRRCVFYHIAPPTEDFFKDILIKKLSIASEGHTGEQNSLLIEDYIKVFNRVREFTTKKEPSTAELINWIFYLRPYILQGKKFSQIESSMQRASYGILAKTSEDLTSLNNLFKI